MVRPDPLPTRPFAEDSLDRRRFGRYYTPSALVRALHRLLAEALGKAGMPPRQCLLVDPSCGPGAFLSAPDARSFRGRLGLDLDARALEEARHGAPGSELLVGDAYGDGLQALTARLGRTGPVAVIGNPPYVANSELLRSGRYHQVRDSLLPFAREVARGTSIRDDYVLFFGVADRLIEAGGGEGAIAFITSASFVDNFLYAPLRRWLLSRYRLHALVDLGPGLFEGTRVSTALSVWVRQPSGHGEASFGHLRLSGTREERLRRIAGDAILSPAYPHGEALLLNAPSPQACRDLGAMRAVGEPITSLFGVTFPGLKTRFDELLADDQKAALERRMRDFFSARSPQAFAKRHGLPDSVLKKLTEAFEARAETEFSPAAIRRYARFAGQPDRFQMRKQAMAWAYVDPKLIPRGDHRFRGPHDPHRTGPKLVFNVRELPLTAAVVEGSVCVHDYRHARFAPLTLPPAFLTEQPSEQPERARAKPVTNLSPTWQKASSLLASPADLLHYACGVINSKTVQERFAPYVGASEEVPIPRIGKASARAAQRIADAARATPSGADLPAAAEKLVARLFRLDE